MSILQSDLCDNKISTMYFEGVLEHFFSENLLAYNEEDVTWFISFLSNGASYEIASDAIISSGVQKYFLKRILCPHLNPSKSILSLFDDKVH